MPVPPGPCAHGRAAEQVSVDAAHAGISQCPRHAARTPLGHDVDRTQDRGRRARRCGDRVRATRAADRHRRARARRVDRAGSDEPAGTATGCRHRRALGPAVIAAQSRCHSGTRERRHRASRTNRAGEPGHRGARRRGGAGRACPRDQQSAAHDPTGLVADDRESPEHESAGLATPGDARARHRAAAEPTKHDSTREPAGPRAADHAAPRDAVDAPGPRAASLAVARDAAEPAAASRTAAGPGAPGHAASGRAADLGHAADLGRAAELDRAADLGHGATNAANARRDTDDAARRRAGGHDPS